MNDRKRTTEPNPEPKPRSKRGESRLELEEKLAACRQQLAEMKASETEFKQVEEALKESEQKFRMMSEQSLLAIGFIQDGLFKYVNQTYSDISGYSIDEIMKWEPYEYAKLVHPDDREYVVEQAMKKQTGASDAVVHYQFKGLTKSGETKWLELYSKTVLYQNRFADLVMFTDITEHKRVEETLRSEREQLLSIFDSIDEIIYISDPDTYEILYVNKILVDAFQENPIGGICYRKFQGFDSPCPFCTNDIIRKQKYTPFSWEYHNPVLNRDYAITDRIIKWPDDRDVRFELAIDITERKRAEVMMQRYNQRLMILREIDRGIATAHSPKEIANIVLKHIRRLIPCWQASVLLYEPDRDEIVMLASEANGDAVMQSGIHSPALPDQMSQIQVSTEGYYLIEDTHTQLESIPQLVQRTIVDGTRSYLNVFLVAENNLVGSLALGSENPAAFTEEDIEITSEVANQLAIAVHQARLKEQIERYNTELEEKVARRTSELQDINAELSAFTYSVSHDLKAPLRGIDGYSRLLLQDYADKLDDEGRFFLHTVRNASQQMSQLIDDLLDYSRLERRVMRIKKLDPKSLVEMVIAERKSEILERQVTLSVDIPCESITAEADGFIMALRNLLENAIKFSTDCQAPHIEIGGRETDKTCILWVRDNGIGFDMKYHDRIFEIFQRLHRTEDYPGTGVGLAIVRKVMQRMGGRVWGESTPGNGATFYLEVPK